MRSRQGLLRCACAAAALAVAEAGAAQAPLRVASLGECRLESGAVLPDCRLSYRVAGALNADRSNAVILPTGFNGTSGWWGPYLGPDRWIDTTRFAAIAVDALGAGGSSSPSDSVWAGRTFPRVTIRDMVEAQRMLLRQLGVGRPYAVVGVSMGGMQAFEWGVAYPGEVVRIVSVVGSPRLASYDLTLWQAMLHTIGSVDRFGVPLDTAAMQLARLFVLAPTTPTAVNAVPPDTLPFRLESQARNLARIPFEDMALQLEAMLSHDVTRAFGGSAAAAQAAFRSRLLVVGTHDDHVVGPGPALAFARAVGADTLVLSSSCGHQVFSCERARIGEAIRTFLGR